MKKLLITTVLLASFTLSAEEPTVNANCSTIETLSREIMTSRQVGVPLSKMLEITPHGTLGRKLTIIAYSSPVYSTVQYQQRAINNFANEALLECVKLGE